MTSIGTFAPGSGGIYELNIGFPPVGTDWSYFVPPRSRWRLICGRTTLVTSVAAGIRRAQFWCASAGTKICQTANYGPQNPLVTQNYTLSPGNDITNSFAGYDIFLAFPPGLLLIAADTFGVTTALLDPADQWGPTILRFEEWIEV